VRAISGPFNALGGFAEMRYAFNLFLTVSVKNVCDLYSLAWLKKKSVEKRLAPLSSPRTKRLFFF